MRRRPAILVALLAIAALFARGALRTRRAIARIGNLEDETVIDDSGAVKSVQSADVILPRAELDNLWSPENLERLARTYWRFLSRCTLGVIRVKYTERERFVCLLFRPFVLLSFQAPEYAMDAEDGVVRWRIESGVLVSAQGRGGNGHLEIRVQRCHDQAGDEARLHVEVEVANFYPAIAHSLSRWLYTNTQSRIHVLVTYGFLRSLANLDLAVSKVGRFARIRQIADTDPQSNGAPPLEATRQTISG
jgi:hypothetical protein